MNPIPALPRCGLYALTPDTIDDTALLVARVLAAIDGGVRLVQYRDKPASAIVREQRARSLVAACHPRGVPVIVNDAVALAAEVGAAGVHIGRDDGDLAAARAALGPTRIIGVSCYDSLDLARGAVAAGADYVAFGSFYASTTKPRAVRCPVDLLLQAAAELPVPIVAIGGITAENAEPLLAAGAGLLAVIHALFDGPDSAAAARAFAAPFSHHKHP
jgi:thiamine-phosphate pyrophosphorylase